MTGRTREEAPVTFHVTRGTDLTWLPDPAGDGLTRAGLVGAAQGSVHLEVSLCELAPGGAVPWHLHPFEESFLVTGGRAQAAVGDVAYDLAEGDFGVAPIATPHTWRQTGADPLQWIEVRAPQPRRIGDRDGVYAAADRPWPPLLGRPHEGDPRHRYAGHFDGADLGPYGPLTMPGYHGPNIRSIAIRMLVDPLLGAQHHTVFVVQFEPNASTTRGAKVHFHPFEEIYYLTRGTALGTLDGDTVRVRAGDLVWMGVNASHGFVNDGDEPVRWLEVQAPNPPSAHAFLFEDDWKEH